MDGLTLPIWQEHAIWWHIYPLGFLGAESQASQSSPVQHRLQRLTKWLDYAICLGASGILLGPIFQSSTHGYDTINHFQIDPRLGTLEDFKSFISEAKSRGLRIILDGVFNHVGTDFPNFKQAIAQGPESRLSEWFHLTWPKPSLQNAPPEYETFEGYKQLVKLNHDTLRVREYVVAVMEYWLNQGIDGWRLDAAYAVPKDFWNCVIQHVRQTHPDAWFLGEMIHGDYANFVSQSGVSTVTQYELWKAIWSSLNDGNLFELAWALKRHNALLDSFIPSTFIGNHDVTRIASRLNNPEHIAHALLILMTCGGIPAIYSGDEQAFRGIKEHRVGGDDEIRPQFPDTPDDLTPSGWNIYRLHQDLIGLRRRHAWLCKAKSQMIHLANRQCSYMACHKEQSLIVALNIGDQRATLPTPLGKNVISGHGNLYAAGTQSANIEIPATGWAILSKTQGNP